MSSLRPSSVFSSAHNEKLEIQIPNPSSALVAGSVLSFVSFVILLFAFASPYWLVSWEYTFSPFINMGLWEFCFKNYRHPNFQFDKLFNGCHYVYSDEYRIIREWLLPGWLMTVQAFITLAFMSSMATLMLLSLMVMRWPLQIILDNEYLFSLIAVCGNAASSFLIFLSVAIFGGQCFRRDWLQYPNFNYLSWAYVFAVMAMFLQAFAALILHKEYKEARERSLDAGGEGHLMFQMQQTNGRSGDPESVAGMSNPGSDSQHQMPINY